MNVTRSLVLLFLSSKLLSLLLWPWSHSAAIVVYFGIDAFVVWQIIVPTAQGLGKIFTRFETTRREVWLTIDDGPDPDDTPQILALLAHHHAKATFFVIGKRAARYPNLISAIHAAGHEIAHHTQTHPIFSFWAAGPRRLRRELGDALQTLAPAGIVPTRFRNPGGVKSVFQEKALARANLTNIAWTIRSWDTVRRRPDAVVKRIMRKVTRGTILLLHEGPSAAKPNRVKAIARLLVSLDTAGYRCVIPTTTQLR